MSLIAYAPRLDRTLSAKERTELDPAPLVALYTTLGSPTAAPRSVRDIYFNPHLLPWLFAVALLALFIEWASRCLRGAP